MSKIALQLGQSYDFRVIDLEENYSNFLGNGGVLKHCHRFILGINDEEIDSQICTDSPTQIFCGKGDNVSALVKSYNKQKNQYTLGSILQRNRAVPSAPPDIQKVTPPTIPVENYSSHRNVLLSGSAAQIALNAAINFETQKSKMPGGDEDPEADDVLATADKFYDWMINKNKIQ